jgi:hypothetical protein
MTPAGVLVYTIVYLVDFGLIFGIFGVLLLETEAGEGKVIIS